MPGSHLFNLGLYQKKFLSTSRVSGPAINMGCTKGRGSTTRMFNYCNEHSANPSGCINQFITMKSEAVIVEDNSNFTLPEAPIIISLISGDETLTVNFIAPSDGGTPITSYEYSIDGIGTYTLPSNNIITGLTNGTIYNIKIRAINAVGTGDWSNIVDGTPLGPPSAPIIYNINSKNTKLQVYSYTPSDGGSPVTDYLYSTNNGITFTSAGTTTGIFTITGLTNGQTYQIVIKAKNIYGTSDTSNEKDGTPESWSALKYGADPSQNGFNNIVRAISFDFPTRRMYIGGDFTNTYTNSVNMYYLAELIEDISTQIYDYRAYQQLDASVNSIISAKPNQSYNGFNFVGGNFIYNYLQQVNHEGYMDNTGLYRQLQDGTTNIYGFPGPVNAFASNATKTFNPPNPSIVYIGGSFTTNGGANPTYNNIAYTTYTGSYSSLKNITENTTGVIGLNDSVNAIAINPVSTSDPAGVVYFGGSFTKLGDNLTGPYNRVIKYYPNNTGPTSQWSPLGSSTQNGVLEGTVLAIAANNVTGFVCIGGEFTTISDSNPLIKIANNIALYDPNNPTLLYQMFPSLDGTTLLPFPGLNGKVRCIMADPSLNIIYVGGDFTADNNGNTFNYLVKISWEANTTYPIWLQIEGGVNGPVYSFENFYPIEEDVLYVGGDFTRSDPSGINLITNYISKINVLN